MFELLVVLAAIATILIVVLVIFMRRRRAVILPKTTGVHPSEPRGKDYPPHVGEGPF